MTPAPSEQPNALTPTWRSAFAQAGGIALIVAATCVGLAIFQHGGEYTPRAMCLISVAVVAAIVSVCHRGARGGAWLDGALIAALLIQFVALLRLWPVGEDQRDPRFLSSTHHALYIALILASMASVSFSFVPRVWARRMWFPLLLVLHAAIGIWTIRATANPKIDVWHFQQISARALLNGRNPYDARQVRFPDIYLSTHEGHQRVYGAGMVVDDVLQFGFPYPPLSLYCSVLGYAIGGDCRFAQALALPLCGLLLGYATGERTSKLAAALLLFTPTVWFLLGRGWTEPLVVSFLAATIFCASRRLRWLTPIALGLLLASKQYLVLAAPLSFLLVENFCWKEIRGWRAWGAMLGVAIAVAALVTLPLALPNPKAFWFSLVTVQKEAPFRWDALSYLVCIGFNIHSKYITWWWLAFVGLIPAFALVIWRAPRTPAGFASAMGLVYLVFIALNKQAFCNYYFFDLACFCAAVAAMSNPPSVQRDRPLPVSRDAEAEPA